MGSRSGAGAPELPRRRLLAAVAGLSVLGGAALSGCTAATSAGGPSASPGPPGPGDPDAALRAEVAREETALARRYAATVAAHPSLAAALAVGERHVAYAAAVTPGGTGASAPASVPPSAGPASTTPPTPSNPGPAVPAAPSAAVAALVGAERSAAKLRLTQCTAAQDRDLARVIVLIGAGCAGAAAVLGGVRG